MSITYIIITADTNDGDYLTDKTKISAEDLEAVKPVIKAIKEFEPYETPGSGWTNTHSHNFPLGEMHRPDMGEKSVEELYGDSLGLKILKDLVPQSEYGSHTITSISVTTSIEVLL